jgi:hypothetical protein
MTLKMILYCDADGCEAEAEIPDVEQHQPVCADEGAGIVVDTGWLTLPKGWKLVGDDEPQQFACPEHS